MMTDLIEGFITIEIILGAIALVYAAGRWVKRQIEGPPGDWVAAKLAEAPGPTMRDQPVAVIALAFVIVLVVGACAAWLR